MRRKLRPYARNSLSLLGFVALLVLVGLGGRLFFADEWYKSLVKPSWTPASAVFAPVWTILYLTIALAGWLAWLRRGDAGERRSRRTFRAAFVFYGLQLVLNFLWSFLFFGLRRPGLASIDIVALGIAILANIVFFYRLRPIAGLLLVPYFAWVGFAALLNLAIWRENL